MLSPSRLIFFKQLAYFGDTSRIDHGEIYRKQQLWLEHNRFVNFTYTEHGNYHSGLGQFAKGEKHHPLDKSLFVVVFLQTFHEHIFLRLSHKPNASTRKHTQQPLFRCYVTHRCDHWKMCLHPPSEKMAYRDCYIKVASSIARTEKFPFSDQRLACKCLSVVVTMATATVTVVSVSVVSANFLFQCTSMKLALQKFYLLIKSTQ